MNEVGNTTGYTSQYMLSEDTALAIREWTQFITMLSLGVGFLCIVYLVVHRRKLERIHGDAGSDTTLFVAVGGALLMEAVFIMINISSSTIHCASHAVLSSSLLPIIATVYLARTWVLIVRFARVSEQTRWFHMYQLPAKERDELKSRKQSITVQVSAFITRHKVLGSTPVLCMGSLIFCAVTWLPMIFVKLLRNCEMKPEHYLTNLIPGFVLLCTCLMLWQFKGKDDSAKHKKELVMISIIFIVFQIMKSIAGVIQDSLDPPKATPSPNPQPPDVILHFLFWYNHLLSAIQICLMITISLVLPFTRLWSSQENYVSKSEANNQRLQEILSSSRYKQEFRRFLEKQFSMENLIFYDLCKDVSNKARSSLPFMDPDVVFEIQESINTIFNDFVSDSSRFQVNLPNAIRNEITSTVKALRSVEVFTMETQIQLIQKCVAALDQASASIFGLLAADSLPRFLQYRKERKKKFRESVSLRHTLSSIKRETVLSKEGRSLERVTGGGSDHHPASAAASPRQ